MLTFTPEQEAARRRLEIAGADARRSLGKRKLDPDEKAALLAKLRARAEAHDEEERREREAREAARATRRWLDLGSIDFDEDREDPPETPGMAALRTLFVELERRRPAWMSDALCLEYQELDWFPGQGVDTAPLKAVCSRCLVADDCKRYAIENGIKDGLWGGLSGRGLRAERTAAA